MGMFDYVNVLCRCGHEVKFQSKAGPCKLAEYTLTDAPGPVLVDINGDAQTCPWCNRTVRITSHTFAAPTFAPD